MESASLTHQDKFYVCSVQLMLINTPSFAVIAGWLQRRFGTKSTNPASVLITVKNLYVTNKYQKLSTYQIDFERDLRKHFCYLT